MKPRSAVAGLSPPARVRLRIAFCRLAIVLAIPGSIQGAPPTEGTHHDHRPIPSDFKVTIELRGVRAKTIARSDLVFREGVAYQFITEVPEEIVLLEPLRSRVVLLDLQQKVQTEVSSKRLNSSLGRLHARLAAVADAMERSGTRSGRVNAAMTRDLIDPKLRESVDPDGTTVHLANATVQVDAEGVREEESLRLMFLGHTLSARAMLDAFRDPEALPPFVALDVLRSLTVTHRLRPTEISYLYRLAGPPKKVRWSYRLAPRLTDREREAIARVEQVRKKARQVPYELYEELVGDD